MMCIIHIFDVLCMEIVFLHVDVEDTTGVDKMELNA